MGKGTYYWDMDENERLSKNTSPILMAYYRKQVTDAQQAIKNISKENFISSISKLNAIDEKLILFHFYQDPTLKGITELTDPKRVIEIIENDYISAFFDVLSPNPFKEIRQRSLVWKLEGINDTYGTLWDDTIREKLTAKELQLEIYPGFKQILAYHLYLMDEAERICQQITAKQFNEDYPTLLGIDSVLQAFLEVIPQGQEYFDTWMEIPRFLEHDLKFLGKEQFDASFGTYSEKSMRRQFSYEKPLLPLKEIL